MKFPINKQLLTDPALWIALIIVVIFVIVKFG